jgi:LEA14-like dessication related protein
MPVKLTRLWPLCLVVGLLVFSACATVKPPTLQVQRVGKSRLGLTGAKLDVEFSLRNPNKEDVVVERAEYELLLNGKSLGRGYISDTVRLAGFAEQRVVSVFDINFLRLPGVIKEILDQDRVAARARGHFYMRKGNSDQLQKVGFDNTAQTRFRDW